MLSKPIIIVSGEPNSIFFEIFFKTLKKNKFKKSIILIGSISLLKLQMKKLNFKRKINQINISNLKGIAAIALIVLVFQIFLGVWTSTNYASLACADFPTCQGSYLPDMDFKNGFNLNQEVGPNYLYGLLDNPARVAIHYSHRISALLVTLIFLILMSRLWFSDAAPLASTLGILLLTQITLGIINVVYVLPLYVAISHNLVAACLLLATFTINYLAWKR